ncbi:MAG: hypothetical protein RJB41_569, partial [Actinomycetota bacterium]
MLEIGEWQVSRSKLKRTCLLVLLQSLMHRNDRVS